MKPAKACGFSNEQSMDAPRREMHTWQERSIGPRRPQSSLQDTLATFACVHRYVHHSLYNFSSFWLSFRSSGRLCEWLLHWGSLLHLPPPTPLHPGKGLYKSRLEPDTHGLKSHCDSWLTINSGPELTVGDGCCTAAVLLINHLQFWFPPWLSGNHLTPTLSLG